MLVGLTVAVRPADALVVRATVPVNPLTGATVMVAVAEDPAFTVRLVVLVVIVKSVTVKVAVVGCGGTGSAVISGLPHLPQALLAYGHPSGLSVTVMDGDRISPTNCVRQPFSASEIGLFKSVVLINRLNLFWGLDWEAVPHHVNASHDLRNDFDLVIGCVDSRAARAKIHETVTGSWCGIPYWLDIGNNADSGQFVLGQPLNRLNKHRAHRLRAVSELFPEITVGYIGLERDDATLRPTSYYEKLPPMGDRHVLLLDPMLATGGSATRACTSIAAKGPAQISFVCVVAAPQGVARMEAEHPEVPVFTAALDRDLTDNGYILPAVRHRAPPGGPAEPLALEAERLQVGEPAVHLVDQALVPDPLGLTARLGEQRASLTGPGRGLLLGGVLDRVVRLEDQLEDLARLHVRAMVGDRRGYTPSHSLEGEAGCPTTWDLGSTAAISRA